MKREDLIKAVEEFIVHVKATDETYREFYKLVASPPDCKFWEGIWKALESHMELLEKLLGGNEENWLDWLEWYIYENRCGENEYTVTISGVEKKICTVEDLMWVFE